MPRLQSLYTLILALSMPFTKIAASAPTERNSGTDPPQLELLFQGSVETGETVQFGSGPGPLGTRVSFPILGGSFSGPRLSGKLLPIGADWGLADAKGEFMVNAFYQFRTDDNVDIFVRSRGVPTSSNSYFHTHLTLETGDPNYYWVNNLLLVGSANATDERNITVDAWEVKLASEGFKPIA